MKSAIVFLHSLLHVTLILSEDNGKNIQFLIKNSKVKNEKFTFDTQGLPGEVGFLDFLKSSQIIIDRTLLITHILENFATGKNFVITAPSRWGKSTFVRMLDFFFSPEVDENFRIKELTTRNAYNFFKYGEVIIEGQKEEFDKPTLLYTNTNKEEEKMINNGLGQHPVLRMSFNGLHYAGSTIMKVENRLRHIFSDAIKKYRPIFRKVCNERKKANEINITDDSVFELCKKYVEYFDERKHSNCIIYTLTKLLYLYFEKKVIIIIDEFHKLPESIYMNSPSINEEERTTLGFYLDILKPIAKMELKEKLFVIFIGIIPVTFPKSSGISVEYYTFMSKEIVSHFGIVSDIADDIMKLADYKETLKRKVKEDFDHYTHPHYPGVHFMNPFSLLSKIHGEELRFPWLYLNQLTEFTKIITQKNREAWTSLFHLLQDKCLDFNLEENRLKNPIRIDTLPQNDMEIWDESKNKKFQEHYLNLLLHIGYLTLTTKQTHEKMMSEINKKRQLEKPKELKNKENLLEESKGKENLTCVKIPNSENRYIFEDFIGIPDVWEIVNLFSKLLFDHTRPISEFGECFATYIDENLQYWIHSSEMYFQAHLYFRITKELDELYNYKSFIDYKMNKKSLIALDIMLHNETCGAVILEIKCNQSQHKFDEANEIQLCKYGKVFHKTYPNVTKVRYILLNVCGNKRAIKVESKEYALSSEKDFLEFENNCTQIELTSIKST